RGPRPVHPELTPEGDVLGAAAAPEPAGRPRPAHRGPASPREPAAGARPGREGGVPYRPALPALPTGRPSHAGRPGGRGDAGRGSAPARPHPERVVAGAVSDDPAGRLARPAEWAVHL